MRAHGLGFLLGVGLTALLIGVGVGRNDSYAQRADTLPAEGALIALTALAGDRQQVTVIDPQQRSMCVYHVNTATGEISLRSARSLRWDFTMEAYNTGEPAPQELRTLFQTR